MIFMVKKRIKKYIRKSKNNKKYLKDKSIKMNKSRWNKDIKKEHGTLTITIHAVLFKSYNTSEHQDYGIWLSTMKFNLVGVKNKHKQILIDLKQFEPEYFAKYMVKEVILYKNYIYYSEKAHSRVFDIATKLLNKITLNGKKLHANYEGISKELAIKNFNKFVGYRIKRNNNLKVLAINYGE